MARPLPRGARSIVRFPSPPVTDAHLRLTSGHDTDAGPAEVRSYFSSTPRPGYVAVHGFDGLYYRVEIEIGVGGGGELTDDRTSSGRDG